ncbi:MAG: DNA primase [Candidatus Margulisbacteria bacterium]|nr:DNA primase [Candidatus Margulisiibacteriota bacterium]
MIPKEKIEEIRQKADIVSVISEYVSLKKRGRNYLGLCPFHSEKTASFTVSPEKQLFHCFGCGEGGNIFAFLMKIEDIGFAEAVHELGNKVGLEVEKPTGQGITKGEKDKLYDVMQLAASFFKQLLAGEQGQAARDYLAQRKISETTAKTFGLGFAPDDWDALVKYLISRGVAPALIERAGLSLPRESKDSYYDRFRSRLLFPVTDIRGRVIAFSGRALGAVEPKYLNSPDSPIYRKGDNIFGLSLAKEAIKKDGFVILVEGNVDLLAVYQSGCLNVGAPLGTALTAQQCKLLLRLTDTVVLAFDSDPAGETASERSAEVLRGQGIKVKVAELKGAKDPDEFIAKNGPETFKAAISSALPFLEFKLKRTIGRHNLKEIESRSKALREVASLLGKETDNFTQAEYGKLAARLLGIDQETVLNEIKRGSYYGRGRENNLRRQTTKPPSKIVEAEKRLIALAAQDLTVLELIKKELRPELFTGNESRAIAELLFSADPSQVQDLPHFVIDNLKSDTARAFLTSLLVSDNLERSDDILTDCINVIKNETVKSRIEGLKNDLREAEKANDHDKSLELLAALKSEIS